MYVLALILDIGFFILSTTSAIMNRGTWIGWLFTALVIWQVFTMIKAIKNAYD